MIQYNLIFQGYRRVLNSIYDPCLIEQYQPNLSPVIPIARQDFHPIHLGRPILMYVHRFQYRQSNKISIISGSSLKISNRKISRKKNSH